jgi:hypothetical protein
VTIELGRARRLRGASVSRATIRIAAAEFVSANGVHVKSMQPITLTATVNGWLAGS